jgi:hypothetical protein
MRILILILALTSFSALADTVPSLQDRLADVDHSCFQRDWANTQCKYVEGDDYPSSMGETYNRIAIVDDILTAVVDLVKRFGMDSTLYYIRRFSAELGIGSKAGAFERRVDFLKLQNQAKDVARKNKLSSCQRACLANCISAHAITYVDGSNARSLVPADTLARGYGICQHFSAMSSFLSNRLGNTYTFAVASIRMGHEFVATQIDGKWWFSEPQDDACTFYPAPAKYL